MCDRSPASSQGLTLLHSSPQSPQHAQTGLPLRWTDAWIQRGRHRPRRGELRAWSVGQRCAKVIQASGAHASLHQAEGQTETSPQARGRNRPNADPARPRTSQHWGHRRPPPSVIRPLLPLTPWLPDNMCTGPTLALGSFLHATGPSSQRKGLESPAPRGDWSQGTSHRAGARYPAPGVGRLAWDLLPLIGAAHPDN